MEQYEIHDEDSNYNDNDLKITCIITSPER